MKVKEIIRKFVPKRSNCTVFIRDGLFGDLIKLTSDDIISLKPDFAMNMTVNCLTITDNVFTIHCDFSKKK